MTIRIRTRILAGFAAVMLLLVGLGAVAYNSAGSLADLTAALYRHPFAVTNALNIADANIIAINRAMKDVALAQQPGDIDRASADVDQREKRVVEEFAIVRARFLGDKAKLEEAATAFAAWKPIRDEAIRLSRDGKRDEAAAVVRTRGTAAIAAVDRPLQDMRKFAVDTAGRFMANATATAERTRAIILGSILFALVVGVGAALLTARAIVRPIGALRSTMLSLAEGRLDIDVPATTRGDEIGEMAKAVEVFKANAVEQQQTKLQQVAAEARAATERKVAMNKMAGDFEAAVGEIVETVSSTSTELERAAGTLTRTAETTQRLSTTVASASEQASANVQSVASATDEMTSSVHEISRQVQESSRIAAEAVKQAERTDSRIGELSQAASRIGDVIKLITAIAEQTNLLALNATIEAARAGEAGRGFAVVANEVKALAAQTGKATGDISAQISGMQAATQDSVAAIKEIGGTIGRIAEIAGAIAAAVEEQGAATGEIARNVQQASAGTTEVARNITDVSRGAGETGAASAQVLSSAQALAGESGRLKREVGKFLQTVRAA